MKQRNEPFRRKAYSQYGASMGRHGGTIQDDGQKLHLCRVRLDNGGYDTGGAYWGIGDPLYCLYTDDGTEQYLRAANREAAKAQILAQHPYANFYR